ncbi:hypothetical protein, partial [Salmonella sp. s54395]|uniref:hypothetical protein n=1 Tax=Salmonella sp. s54395 TaxID=3159664 RepID=UPI00397F7D2A
WTESAFRKLDAIYGTWKKASERKLNYNLPMPKMAVPDLTKLVTSAEISGQIRPAKRDSTRRRTTKKNPLKNAKVMKELNPYSEVQKRAAKLQQVKAAERRQALIDKKRGIKTVEKKNKPPT